MAKLSEIMTTDVHTTAADTPVAEAARAMVTGRFGSVIVLDSGWLSGIFTERDVLRAAAAGGDLSATPVGEWMTKDPTTVEGDMDSEEAAQIMATNGFRHLPVVEGKNLLGLVSLRDVLSTRIARTPR
ncbi:MAG TPA: CBS domain-containing protein [Actinomycetota bacterium]